MGEIEGETPTRTAAIDAPVALHIADAPAFAAALESRGVRVGALGPQTVRLVTHYEIGDDDVTCVLEAAEQAVAVAA